MTDPDAYTLPQRLCAAFWGDRDGGEGRWAMQDADTQQAWGLVADAVMDIRANDLYVDRRIHGTTTDEQQTPYQHQQLTGGMTAVQATNATVLVAPDGSYAIHVSKRDGKVKRVELLQGSPPAR